MKIAITGASGLIGSALVPALERAGHRVWKLVRRPAGSSDEIPWNPTQTPDPALLSQFDAVIHLAARTIGTRWTAKVKAEARESRVSGTKSIAQASAESFRRSGKPAVLISASAVGYYGSRGDEVLTEASASGFGFLAEVAREWEAATGPASDAGVRVVLPRLSMVLAANGGGLAKMLLPFRMGLGGPIGSGRQWMSWITLQDVIAGFTFALENTTVSGPVNLTAPNPVTNAEFVKALGAELHRPAVFPLPAMMVRLMFGEMGEEVLLGSTRVIPTKLQAEGFRFQHAEIREAFRAVLTD